MSVRKNVAGHEGGTDRFNAYLFGVDEYTLEDIAEVPPVDHDDPTYKILEAAFSVFTYNNRKRDVFNAHPKNRQFKRSPLDLELPERVDPRQPILQLASTSITGFGFASVVSIDSSASMKSWRTTEQMADWVQGIDNKHSLDTGAVLFVEHSEDSKNTRLRPRLELLQGAMSQLAVPHLTIVTTEVLGNAPSSEDVILEVEMLKPRHDDGTGPGMGLL